MGLQESKNLSQPQTLPLITLEQPDPARRWLKEKLKEKRSRKRRKRGKRKGRKQQRRRRSWEEGAVGFVGNLTSATASFPFKSLTTNNIELRFRSWKKDGVLFEAGGGLALGHGLGGDDRGGTGDFLILRLVKGNLELSWELGSGPGRLVVESSSGASRQVLKKGGMTSGELYDILQYYIIFQE